MSSSQLQRRFLGFGLLTAEIVYRLPDYPSILQKFIWQTEDLAPKFPELTRFLDYWDREIEGPIHRVIICHQQLIKPTEFRYADGEFIMN